MFDRLILSPEEKLKEIIIKLGIKQKELTGKGVSASYISQVLKKDSNICLTTKTAPVICENIERIIKENNLDEALIINPEDLMKSKNEQLRDVINGYIKEIEIYKSNDFNNKFYDLISEIEHIFYKYDELLNLESKVLIYKEISNVFGCKYKWNEGSQYILKAIFITSAKKIFDLTVELILDVIRFDLRVKTKEKYEEIVTLSSYAFEIIKEYKIKNETLIKKIYFNRALALKNIGRVRESLDIIEYLENKYTWTKEELTKIHLLLGNCKHEVGDLIGAKHIYSKIITNFEYENDGINIARTLRNLAEVSYNLGDMNAAKEYINSAKNVKNINDNTHKAMSYYYSVLINIKINEKESVLEEALSSVEYLNSINDSEREFEIIEKVTAYFIHNSYDDKLDTFLDNIENNIYIGKYLNRNLHEIFFDASTYYKNKNLTKSDVYYNKKLNLKKFIFKSFDF